MARRRCKYGRTQRGTCRKSRKRRHFGASTWQITERAFARRGRSPRRLHYCKTEAKILAAVMKKVGRMRSAHLASDQLMDAWQAINSGRCRVARKRITKFVKSHRGFLTKRDRLEREGLILVPGRDLARIWAER